MEYIRRALQAEMDRHLARGKSLLLLGPRQTGKTTLLQKLPSDLSISLDLPSVRQRYERNPSALLQEIAAVQTVRPPPLVVLDEVQKVPSLLDVVQHAIDRGAARFVLSGSSARKLRRGGAVNLLPGRVVTLRIDPLSLSEHPSSNLEELLIYGSLPGIRAVSEPGDRETDLRSYVETYIEEEVRSEALVRNVGTFSRFLELAGLESGRLASFRAQAQDVGVTHATISGYYEILEDCLVAERVDPLTRSRTRKRLTRSSRYQMFDLGVRRICAREGPQLSRERLGSLFEQFVGLELIRRLRASARVLFWRNPDGPEVDWVVDSGGALFPIEVKWTDAPGRGDARHLEVFLSEYPDAPRGYVVCRAPRAARLTNRILAIPWQELPGLRLS